MAQRLLTVQYSTRPLGAHTNMNVKTMGMNIIIFCCIGSAVEGVIFCCTTIVMPIRIGVTNSGSCADRSWIQPMNGAPRSSMATDSIA